MLKQKYVIILSSLLVSIPLFSKAQVSSHTAYDAAEFCPESVIQFYIILALFLLSGIFTIVSVVKIVRAVPKDEKIKGFSKGFYSIILIISLLVLLISSISLHGFLGSFELSTWCGFPFVRIF